jgi:DNA-directed RNA polymerase specialized sigma24 family protein
MLNDEAIPLSIGHSALRVTKVDEAALLTLASEGDEAAFGELYARYQRQIYHYAARMCGVAAGDDVVQETFLAVLRQGGVIQCPIGTVRSRLHRARGLLLRKLSAVPSMAAMSRV